MSFRDVSVGWCAACFVLGLSTTISPPALAETQTNERVRAGKLVSFEYTLRLNDHIVLDSNVGEEPLSYVHGLKQLMPGLEKGLQGLKEGESKKIVVQPEDGYGPVDEHAYMEAKKSDIPEEALEVGAVVEGVDSTGPPIYPRIKEIGEEEVILDYNHPLAGKVLYFDVKVLEVKKPPVQPHGE